MADTRCPKCDHVYAPEEAADGWCSECGKQIPEVLLKDLRPKPHLRNPHPHPLPAPTPETQLEQSRETKLRLGGLLAMLGAVLLGMAFAGWGLVNQTQSASVGTGPWVGGGVALAIFLVGAVLFNRGETSEE